MPGRNPEVDVVLPVRSPAPWLAETLEGLRRQTLTDWRLICTLARDSSYLKHQIHAIFPKATILEVPNEWTFPAVLNKAFQLGQAQFIARIDQDDVPTPSRLEVQRSFLAANPMVAVVSTPVIFMNQDGHSTGTGFENRQGDLRRRLLIRNQIAHPAVMIRRSSLPSCEPYSEIAENGEDYELWLRIAKQGNIQVLPEPLTKYRRHPDQMSATRVMNHAARKLVLRRRVELADAIGVSQTAIRSYHLVWSMVQIFRSIVRSLHG